MNPFIFIPSTLLFLTTTYFIWGGGGMRSRRTLAALAVLATGIALAAFVLALLHAGRR